MNLDGIKNGILLMTDPNTSTLKTQVVFEQEIASQKTKDHILSGNGDNSINKKEKPYNIYYLIQVNDPGFRLSAKSARKAGVKAEFLSWGWVYKNKEDAEEVAKRWTDGKRELKVVNWFDPRLDAIWNGSTDEARLAKKAIKHELESDKANKKRQEIILQCHPLHYSWLCCEKIPDNLSSNEKKAHAFFKPIWDEMAEKEKDIDLLEADIARENEDIEEEKKEKQKGEKFPWNEIEIPFGYEIKNDGVWKVSSSAKKNENKSDTDESQVEVKICNPVWVAGRSRDYAGSNSGLIIRWVDMDAITRETCIERRKLHTTGNPIAEELAHNNLAIVPGKEKDLSRYLSAFTTNKTYRAVKSLGWLENPTGDLLYVSKKHTFRNHKTNLQEEIIFQPETISGGPSSLECRGTLAEWKENIAAPCRGNSVPIFLMSHALSGTIVKYADTGSTGIHVSGLTSRGKTTAAQVAASTMGCAADPSYAPKLSIIKRWLATANALESLASQSTDSVLVLDEIGQCPGSDLDKVIYNLFGGRGKERLTQQSQQRATRDWCTVVISTGEKTLQERLAETNSKTPAGLFVRFIDIHVNEVFTDYHLENHKTFVDKLKRDCGLFYGSAANAFIQNIVDIYKNSQDLRESISKGCAELANDISCGAPLSQEHSRVLKIFSFATLAGVWASEWGVFPYSREEIVSSARSLFEKWHNGNQKQTEDVRCICSVRDYYLKKRDSAFRPRYLNDMDIKRFGDVYGYTTTEGKFYLTEEGLKEASGVSRKVAQKALFQRGYLLKEESQNRYDSRKTIDGIGSPRVFVISEKISISTRKRYDFGNFLGKSKSGKIFGKIYISK